MELDVPRENYIHVYNSLSLHIYVDIDMDIDIDNSDLFNKKAEVWEL